MTPNKQPRRGPGEAHRDAAGQEKPSTPRKVKPRAPVAVAAAYVSQLTCLALLGLNDRRFLDVLVPRCAGDVVSVGKLRLVPLDVAVARLRELASTDGEDEPEHDQGDDDQPTSASDVYRRLGRTGGP